MKKVWAVIRREFVERVRTKAFLVGTFLGPLLLVFFMVMPAVMLTGGARTQRIAIVDATTDGVGARIEQGLRAEVFISRGESFPRYELTRVEVTESRIEPVRDSLVGSTGFSRQDRPDALDGVLVISDATITDGRATYFGSNVGSIETIGRFEGAVSQVVRSARFERAGVDPTVVAGAMSPVRLSTTKVEEGRATGQSGEAAFILAYAMGFVLYIAIFMYGQQTALSVIEEKNSRIMEVLASSLRPSQMLLGKILGVGGVGLFQLSIWAGTAFAVTTQRVRLAALFGLDAAAIQSVPLPQFPADLLAVTLGYFILGFFIYGALFAAIGSMVNSMQEMQQVITPVMLLVVMGFFGVFAAIRDPSAGLAVSLSFVPFFSPMVMPVRWSMASVPFGELAISLLLMVLGVLAVAWLAGRIYRTGILMYGKKPSVGEVWRWIKAG